MSKPHLSRPALIAIICAILVLLSLGIFLIFQIVTPPPVDNPTPSDPPLSTTAYQFDYSWTEHPYIAHALGGINGETYTNSPDALLLNYALGHRVFEVDLTLTDDNHLVLAHDPPAWSQPTADQPQAFTRANFLSHLISDQYHSADLTQLLRLMQKYPDFYVVTDSKASDEPTVRRQFEVLVQTAADLDPTLLDRFIIQIYHPTMLDWIMSIHPWRSVILTLYNYPDWTPENVLDFATTSGVKFITMWDNWVTADIMQLWQPAGIQVAAHTVNDLNSDQALRKLGVSVIYTDFLFPSTQNLKPET